MLPQPRPPYTGSVPISSAFFSFSCDQTRSDPATASDPIAENWRVAARRHLARRFTPAETASDPFKCDRLTARSGPRPPSSFASSRGDVPTKYEHLPRTFATRLPRHSAGTPARGRARNPLDHILSQRGVAQSNWTRDLCALALFIHLIKANDDQHCDGYVPVRPDANDDVRPNFELSTMP